MRFWRRASVALVGLGLGSAALVGQPVAAAPPGHPSSPAPASAPTHHAPGPVPAGADVHHGRAGEADANVCGYSATPGVAHCDARVRTDAAAAQARPRPSGAPAPSAAASSTTLGNGGAYDPAYLQSAYNDPVFSLPSLGAGQTVAIVDAYDDPNVYPDLTSYRSYFYKSQPSLAPCPLTSLSSGKVLSGATGCHFYKVNQTGGTSYPVGDTGWATEISLDVDMVSAMCPSCQILLVEATTANLPDLGTAVNEAVALGANAVSNSYGASEYSTETADSASYYRHLGVPIVVAAGDSGYGAEYPAASQFVTAVGGTTLTVPSGGTTTGARAAGTSETTWSGTGSGCSAYEPSPSWQSAVDSTSDCPAPPGSTAPGRLVADVSAVADPNTGVWVYDSYGTTCSGTGLSDPCFAIYGGTSVATPIISSIYALAGDNRAAADYPAHYPYLRGSASTLTDVTSGSNGTGGPSLYGVSCLSTGSTGGLCVGIDSLGDAVYSTNPTAPGSWGSYPTGDALGLSGVSCPTATFCAAIDNSGNFLYTRSPTTAGAWKTTMIDLNQPLNAISCPNAGFCVAVDGQGQAVTVSVNASTGKVTSHATTVDPTPYGVGYLSGISCPSPSLCVAVDFDGNAVVLPITSGSLGPPSAAAVDNVYALDAISCATATQCLAADGNGDVVSITVQSGGSPKPSLLADIDGGTSLTSVSCWGANPSNQCIAVDDSGAGFLVTLPSSGTPTSVPVNLNDGNNWMESVACVATSLCAAVDGNGNVATTVTPTSSATSWQAQAVEAECSQAYLCTAGGGYDGPTGLGTPLGLVAFTGGTLAVTTTSVPAGALKTAYSTQLQAVGGTPPYSWTMSTSSGALPAGLAWSATGAITGTPTAAGAVTFTATATDSTTPSPGSTTSVSLTLTVGSGGGGGSTLTITTTTIQVRGGAPFSYQLGATGGKAPYSWQVPTGSTLPKGLSLSSGGLLKGTAPAKHSSYTPFSVRVTDSSSPQKTATALIKVTGS